VAVDGGDGGLLEVLQHRVGALEEPAELRGAAQERAPAVLFRHPLSKRSVGARGKHGRGAGHDDHPHGAVVAQLGEDRGQLGQHGVAQRIAPVGSVQRDRGDRHVADQRDVLTHGVRGR
jgi:hypothetical protein